MLPKRFWKRMGPKERSFITAARLGFKTAVNPHILFRGFSDFPLNRLINDGGVTLFITTRKALYPAHFSGIT